MLVNKYGVTRNAIGYFIYQYDWDTKEYYRYYLCGWTSFGGYWFDKTIFVIFKDLLMNEIPKEKNS